jgi:predicted dehydrogenase
MGKLSVYNRCEDRRDPDEPGKAVFDSSNWPPLSQKKVSPKIDVEDHNMVMMELDNGVQVSYMQCHYTPDAWRNYTIIGTEGRIENRGDVGRCRVEVTNVRYDGFEDPDIIHQLKPAEGGHGGGDPRIVEEFLAFLRGDVDVTNTSPVAARNAVAVGVKGAESIRNGNAPYDIPPLAPGVREYFDGGQPGSSNA